MEKKWYIRDACPKLSLMYHKIGTSSITFEPESHLFCGTFVSFWHKMDFGTHFVVAGYSNYISNFHNFKPNEDEESLSGPSVFSKIQNEWNTAYIIKRKQERKEKSPAKVINECDEASFTPFGCAVLPCILIKYIIYHISIYLYIWIWCIFLYVWGRKVTWTVKWDRAH